MLGITLFCLFALAQASNTVPPEIDQLNNLSLDEFEDYFGFDHITDPVEKARREQALKENEDMVKKANEAYLNGETTWFEKINEFADLPKDEFEAGHTGLVTDYARGLITPSSFKPDKRSEEFFARHRLSRQSVPESYDARALGLVTPVKSQGSCGSCTAFANMAAVETCFAKKLGNSASNVGDYSEQHFVDCGYNRTNVAYGCDGAALNAYVKWFTQKNPDLASEENYPYKAVRDTCQQYMPFSQGVSITGGWWTYSGDEELLKKLVYEYGAVITSLAAAGPWSQYGGGIFAGCTSDSQDHAVTVVGYGNENGEDYWLVKNSWGTWWGENGYIKMKRGVGMCGIGEHITTVSCEVSGDIVTTTTTTAAPTTTTTTQAPEGCTRTEGEYICAGYEAGNSTQTETEAECAAYCWGIEGCQFYSYHTNGWCYPETASTCTGQYEGWTWGSRECGAPTDACVLQEQVKICNGNRIGRNQVMESAGACADLCASTDGCVGWNFRTTDGMCQRKKSLECTQQNNNFVTGTKECGGEALPFLPY